MRLLYRGLECSMLTQICGEIVRISGLSRRYDAVQLARTATPVGCDAASLSFPSQQPSDCKSSRQS